MTIWFRTPRDIWAFKWYIEIHNTSRGFELSCKLSKFEQQNVSQINVKATVLTDTFFWRICHKNVSKIHDHKFESSLKSTLEGNLILIAIFSKKFTENLPYHGNLYNPLMMGHQSWPLKVLNLTRPKVFQWNSILA